jgi:hypothetical protein
MPAGNTKKGAPRIPQKATGGVVTTPPVFSGVCNHPEGYIRFIYSPGGWVLK